MKKLYIFFFLINISCNQKKDAENFKTSYKTNTKIVGDFNRENFSIIEEGIILRENGNFNKAIEKFNLAEKEYGEMVPIFINRGVAYNQNGEMQNSISDFSKCLKIDKNNFAALLNRGLAYAKTEKFENSLKDLNLALEINKTEPSVYINKAVMYFIKKEKKLGCENLQKAMKLDIEHNYEEEISKLLIENCR